MASQLEGIHEGLVERRQGDEEMTKHTPGPWRIESYPIKPKFGITSWCVYSDNDCDGEPEDIIAEVYGREPIEANAKLIAQSPNLLAALIDQTELVESLGESCGYSSDQITNGTAQARAAIKAATE